jgi:hypothetical protein
VFYNTKIINIGQYAPVKKCESPSYHAEMIDDGRKKQTPTQNGQAFFK